MPSPPPRLTSSIHIPSTRDGDGYEPVEGRSGVFDSAPINAFAVADKETWASLTHLLQKYRKKLPPASFALAPAMPLPLWQRVAVSTIKRIEFDEEDQKRATTAQAKLGKELHRYQADAQAREERLRRQQRAARAQAGGRLAAAAHRFWCRKGELFQSLQRVEFDLLQRHRDKRKQEDLLKETEELTRKLLDSIIADKPRDAAVLQIDRNGASEGEATVEEAFRQSGRDGSVEIESSIALLDTEGGKRPLRHYQRSALHWMIHLFENKLNGILADEMGLGKTVQTIALLCYYAQYKNDWGPHLIVVPTTVVLNWKAELQRWAPGLKVLTYIGSSKERLKLRHGWTSEDAFHICVTSYNLVVQDRRVFRKRAWGFLVLDEAHQVKNFMSKKWQSLFDLQAEYRLLLTGTPLQNSIMELWSLFHFLLPFASAFRSNEEFKEWFSNPLDDMITGRSSLNEDIVRRLQALIRPFMLRRLKKDVETQLPTKTEKVVMCRLSRRQRALYDDYMQLADTKQRLRGGGAGGVLSVLLGLRKVCDHPDLFEERPTVSPFALDRFAMITLGVPRAVLLRENDFRGRYRFPSFSALRVEDVNADHKDGTAGGAHEERRCADCFAWLPCQLASLVFHVGDDPICTSAALRGEGDVDAWATRFMTAHFPETVALRSADRVLRRASADLASLSTATATANASAIGYGLLSAFGSVLAASVRASRNIHEGHRQTARIQAQRYGAEVNRVVFCVPRTVLVRHRLKDAWIQTEAAALCPTVAARAAAVLSTVQKVAVFVPPVVAVFPPRLHCAFAVRRPDAFHHLTQESCATLMGFTQRKAEAQRGDREWRRDLFDASSFLAELWPMQVRRCFSFPDKRLLIHDCGKLQFLAAALKQQRQEGHRMLIFTQFVHMLNILERFLALVGVAYLRLDGSTRAEVRQAMVDRFNDDTRITCMILSTRSGGIGLNLTGADTVIFYDSDWNPTMDLQAQDRCHRIGQTRPVTIYRLISEHTVEEAILEKARERKKLNNVVIRGGQFHTIAGVGEEYEDTAAAFAALSDPVNLRSFFHDYDEDVTLATTAAESAAATARGTPDAILAEMAKIEDAEDREAGAQLVREMQERAEADVAEQGEELEACADDHTSDDGDASPREPFPSGVAAVASAASRKEALATQEAVLERILAQSSPHLITGFSTASSRGEHPELVDAGLAPVARKRRRDVLAKARSPLDRLLAAQYGVCREGDAWVRYDKLCDAFEAKLVDEDARLNGRGGAEEEMERLFPAFRRKLEF